MNDTETSPSPETPEPPPYRTDPKSYMRDVVTTDIFVRAQRPDDSWDAVDIWELSLESLIRWLRSRGGQNPHAESVLAAALGHESKDYERTLLDFEHAGGVPEGDESVITIKNSHGNDGLGMVIEAQGPKPPEGTPLFALFQILLAGSKDLKDISGNRQSGASDMKLSELAKAILGDQATYASGGVEEYRPSIGDINAAMPNGLSDSDRVIGERFVQEFMRKFQTPPNATIFERFMSMIQMTRRVLTDAGALRAPTPEDRGPASEGTKPGATRATEVDPTLQ